MTEQQPEAEQFRENEIRHSELGEQKSITGSGQTIGLTPGENFIAPTMALDSLDDEQHPTA